MLRKLITIILILVFSAQSSGVCAFADEAYFLRAKASANDGAQVDDLKEDIGAMAQHDPGAAAAAIEKHARGLAKDSSILWKIKMFTLAGIGIFASAQMLAAPFRAGETARLQAPKLYPDVQYLKIRPERPQEQKRAQIAARRILTVQEARQRLVPLAPRDAEVPDVITITVARDINEAAIEYLSDAKDAEYKKNLLFAAVMIQMSETQYKTRKQRKGPGRGFSQFEAPTTTADLWKYIKLWSENSRFYKPKMAEIMGAQWSAISSMNGHQLGQRLSDAQAHQYADLFNSAMTVIKINRSEHAVPDRNDLAAVYDFYLKCWSPGRPISYSRFCRYAAALPQGLIDEAFPPQEEPDAAPKSKISGAMHASTDNSGDIEPVLNVSARGQRNVYWAGRNISENLNRILKDIGYAPSASIQPNFLSANAVAMGMLAKKLRLAKEEEKQRYKFSVISLCNIPLGSLASSLKDVKELLQVNKDKAILLVLPGEGSALGVYEAFLKSTEGLFVESKHLEGHRYFVCRLAGPILTKAAATAAEPAPASGEAPPRVPMYAQRRTTRLLAQQSQEGGYDISKARNSVYEFLGQSNKREIEGLSKADYGYIKRETEKIALNNDKDVAYTFGETNLMWVGDALFQRFKKTMDLEELLKDRKVVTSVIPLWDEKVIVVRTPDPGMPNPGESFSVLKHIDLARALLRAAYMIHHHGGWEKAVKFADESLAKVDRPFEERKVLAILSTSDSDKSVLEEARLDDMLHEQEKAIFESEKREVRFSKEHVRFQRLWIDLKRNFRYDVLVCANLDEQSFARVVAEIAPAYLSDNAKVYAISKNDACREGYKKVLSRSGIEAQEILLGGIYSVCFTKGPSSLSQPENKISGAMHEEAKKPKQIVMITKSGRLDFSKEAIRQLTEGAKGRAIVYDIGIGWSRDKGPVTTKELARELHDRASVYGIDSQLPKVTVEYGDKTALFGELALDELYDGESMEKELSRKLIAVQAGLTFWLADSAPAEVKSAAVAAACGLIKKAKIKNKSFSRAYYDGKGDGVIFNAADAHRLPNLDFRKADLFDLANTLANTPKAHIVRISNLLLLHYPPDKIKDALVSLLPFVHDKGYVFIGEANPAGFQGEQYLVYRKSGDRFVLTSYLVSVRTADLFFFGKGTQNTMPVPLDYFFLDAWEKKKEFKEFDGGRNVYYEKYGYSKSTDTKYEQDALMYSREIADFAAKDMREHGIMARALARMLEIEVDFSGNRSRWSSQKTELMQSFKEWKAITGEVPFVVAAGGRLDSRIAGAMHDAAELNIDKRPVEHGLLAACYVGYDHAVKNVVNPDNRPLVGLYGASGVDVANFLLSTNCTVGYFVDFQRLHTQTLLDAYSQWGQNKQAQVYKIRKYAQGFADFGDERDADEYHTYRSHALMEELQALGVKKEDVVIDEDKNARPRLRFKWAYPGDAIKERTIVFIKTRMDRPERYTKDLREIIEKGVDVYYQHASMILPMNYGKFLPIVASSVKEGGFLVMDNYIVPANEISPEPYINQAEPGFVFTGNILSTDKNALMWVKKVKDFRRAEHIKRIPYGWQVSVMQKTKYDKPAALNEAASAIFVLNMLSINKQAAESIVFSSGLFDQIGILLYSVAVNTDSRTAVMLSEDPARRQAQEKMIAEINRELSPSNKILTIMPEKLVLPHEIEAGQVKYIKLAIEKENWMDRRAASVIYISRDIARLMGEVDKKLGHLLEEFKARMEALVGA